MIFERNGIFAEITWSPIDRVFWGKLKVDDLITFEAETGDEVIEEFKKTVDDYLKFKDNDSRNKERNNNQ